eukprot:CAMPEP_0170471198 /NCGR_PEP_ID=MMETSP0123-20130129/13479_1 /TAXON_ID=182087 /ORGANISM="Favella ehrenbergii, Strain Fehren 1" /LENGTH=42 /DNA_ID= /DNA_START= /DNA_END= /DNA_ORIENTATION=
METFDDIISGGVRVKLAIDAEDLPLFEERLSEAACDPLAELA